MIEILLYFMMDILYNVDYCHFDLPGLSSLYFEGCANQGTAAYILNSALLLLLLPAAAPSRLIVYNLSLLSDHVKLVYVK